MYYFSEKSQKILNTCHKDLIILFYEVIEHRDCTIVCGHRNKEEQDNVYNKRLSNLKYPNSKHNSTPSLAVDVVPYINGKAIFGNTQEEKNQMVYFAGFVLGISEKLFDTGAISHKIRWGGDWNRDFQFNEKFIDYPHFELIEV